MGDGFDRVLNEIGVIGSKQIAIATAIMSVGIMTAWTILIPVYIGAKPSWVCPNFPNETLGASTTALYPSNRSHENACTADNRICPGIRYTSDFTSVVTEWNLICRLGHISTLITTCQMAGIFFGALIFGHLADTFGRKSVFFTIMTLNSIIGFCSAFVPRWEIYAAMRFSNGMFCGGLMLIGFVWPMEFIGTKWRIYAKAINFWIPAALLLPLLAYYIRDWKTLLMVTTPFPTVFLWLLWRCIPESPRWLLLHDRIEEADEILRSIAEANRKKPISLDLLKKYVKEEKANAATLKHHGVWDLCRTPQLTKYTLVFMFQWFVYSTAFYGMSLNVKQLLGDIYINSALLSALDLVSTIFIVTCGNRIGRRLLQFISMLIGGLSMISILFIGLAGKADELDILVTTLALIGKLGVSAAWGTGYIYTVELYPTVIRSIGAGTASMAARVGGVTAPQFELLGNISRELPFTVFGILALAAAFLGLLLPETKNRRLPDSLPERSLCCGSVSVDAHSVDSTAGAVVVQNEDAEKSGKPTAKESSFY